MPKQTNLHQMVLSVIINVCKFEQKQKQKPSQHALVWLAEWQVCVCALRIAYLSRVRKVKYETENPPSEAYFYTTLTRASICTMVCVCVRVVVYRLYATLMCK